MEKRIEEKRKLFKYAGASNILPGRDDGANVVFRDALDESRIRKLKHAVPIKEEAL